MREYYRHDARTRDIVNRLKIGGADRFRAKTGLPLATYFSAPKVIWIIEVRRPGKHFKIKRNETRQIVRKHNRQTAAGIYCILYNNVSRMSRGCARRSRAETSCLVRWTRGCCGIFQVQCSSQSCPPTGLSESSRAFFRLSALLSASACSAFAFALLCGGRGCVGSLRLWLVGAAPSLPRWSMRRIACHRPDECVAHADDESAFAALG